jgi:hypothetical protein
MLKIKEDFVLKFNYDGFFLEITSWTEESVSMWSDCEAKQ